MFAQKDGKSSREKLVTGVFVGALVLIIAIIALRFTGLITATESIVAGFVVVVVFLVVRVIDLRMGRSSGKGKLPES